MGCMLKALDLLQNPAHIILMVRQMTSLAKVYIPAGLALQTWSLIMRYGGMDRI